MPNRLIPDLRSKRLVTPRDGSTLRLPLLDGPWMEDQWVVVTVAGNHPRAGKGDCAIGGCAVPAHSVVEEIGLCHGHFWRWDRDGRPPPQEWSARPHSPVATTSVSSSRRPFDFSTLPPQAAEEIRYVVGQKICNGDWTPNKAVRTMLEDLRGVLIATGEESFSARRAEDWILLVQQAKVSGLTHFESSIRPYLRSFFSTLNRGLIADPWAESTWLWKGMFDIVLGASRYSTQVNLAWSDISQEWLREPLKLYARQCLVTGTREWGTIYSWTRGFNRLSSFLQRISIDDPEGLTRQVFLLFLEEERALRENSVNALQLVNQVAAVLTSLKIDGFQPTLASEIYLRPGENAVTRKRQPRPWPRDIVGKIESRLLESDDVDKEVRLMLRFCRWGAPRIGELVSLRLDSVLENGKGGYWVEYWMPKVKRHRRFPVPVPLGKQLVAQRERVYERYGHSATLMFPQPTRSSETAGVTRPWTASGFRLRVADMFVQAGIISSAITGEPVSGADIHRFRHTIGTELLNNGWTQQEVMEFLGHVSPTMTAVYARINDETLNRKADEYHREMAAEQAARGEAFANPKVERMREKIVGVTPAGYCTLPANQSCSVRSNPCLTCSFHSRGDGAFDETRGVYRTRLKATIVQAQSNNDRAGADLNEKVLADLDALEEGYG